MASPRSAARRLIQAMPKAELHVHLDGCLRPVTAIELAASRGVDAPRTFAGMFDVLVADEHPGSQADLLRSFALPIALMQDVDALARITTELIEDKAADRVQYMEIKWAPAIHRERGLSLDEVIEAVTSAATAASARLGVVAVLTAVAIRSEDPSLSVEVAAAAVRHRAAGVTGFDVAGYEAAWPDPTIHAEAFEVARTGGLGLTVHAGELLDDGALVRRAIQLPIHRIAHGASAAADPSLVAELIARGITLDLCPTSNVQAGTVDRIADHPLARLLRAGVGITINTDDTTISDVSLSDELISCHEDLDLTLPEIWRCTLHALHAAFVDDARRDVLRSQFEAWAHHVPDLHDA